jgi:hypothetical protein
VPLFVLPFGVAVRLRAGLGGVALGVRLWLAMLAPIVRHLAAGCSRTGACARYSCPRQRWSQMTRITP